jgi:hypothetical protein
MEEKLRGLDVLSQARLALGLACSSMNGGTEGDARAEQLSSVLSSIEENDGADSWLLFLSALIRPLQKISARGHIAVDVDSALQRVNATIVDSLESNLTESSSSSSGGGGAMVLPRLTGYLRGADKEQSGVGQKFKNVHFSLADDCALSDDDLSDEEQRFGEERERAEQLERRREQEAREREERRSAAATLSAVGKSFDRVQAPPTLNRSAMLSSGNAASRMPLKASATRHREAQVITAGALRVVNSKHQERLAKAALSRKRGRSTASTVQQHAEQAASNSDAVAAQLTNSSSSDGGNDDDDDLDDDLDDNSASSDRKRQRLNSVGAHHQERVDSEQLFELRQQQQQREEQLQREHQHQAPVPLPLMQSYPDAFGARTEDGHESTVVNVVDGNHDVVVDGSGDNDDEQDDLKAMLSKIL